MIKIVYTGILLLASSALIAGELPRESLNDNRIGYVTYKPDSVFNISVRRGVVTRIIFEADEKIIDTGTGFTADCGKDDFEWCIRAAKDTNQIWVKPRKGATHNNLEVATSKRDYSFRLDVLPDSPKGKAADDIYRVIFQYPVPKVSLPPALFADANATSLASDKQIIEARLSEQPLPRNTNYSMETLGGGDLIAPSIVFDDGRFTYFQFPNAREIPVPFAINPDGLESRVKFHVDGDFLVIQRLAPRFVLRLGESVVAIWNENYESDGIPTHSGTTSLGVKRQVK